MFSVLFAACCMHRVFIEKFISQERIFCQTLFLVPGESVWTGDVDIFRNNSSLFFVCPLDLCPKNPNKYGAVFTQFSILSMSYQQTFSCAEMVKN